MLSVGLLLQFLVIFFLFFFLFRSTCFAVFVHFCCYVIRFPFDIFLLLFEFGGRECVCVALSSSSLLAIEKLTGKRRWREENRNWNQCSMVIVLLSILFASLPKDIGPVYCCSHKHTHTISALSLQKLWHRCAKN